MSNKLKKVLICIPSFTLGGAENHSFLIAKILKSMGGFEPIMFSFSKREDAIPMYEKEGIQYLSYYHQISLNDSFLVKLTKLIRLILFLRKQHIYATVSSTYLCNFNMAAARKWSGIKHFYWRQAGIDDGITVSIFETFAIKGEINYLCNSEWVKQYIKKRHQLIHDNNIHVINNAVFERPILKTSKAWRKELSISDEAIILVMTANYFLEKDFETLLKAFKVVLNHSANKDIKLILAGNAPGISPSKNNVKALAFDLKLQDEVYFIDGTNDVFGLYQASDIGVLSTLSEGLSNSLIEYMFCGLPIVATNIPPNVEAIPDETKNCLFEVKNVNDCAEKILLLINDQKLCKHLGEVNKKWAKEKYSKERFFCEYKALFENLKNE